MDSCDVLIVGGGPAGASCAHRLRDSGLSVLIVDRANFPREKPCAGWVTPPVFELLGIEPAEYSAGRTLQPIRRFLTGRIGDRPVETRYESVVSWGVRRCEFDRFLLGTAGCRVLEGTTVTSLVRRGKRWICNGDLDAAIVVGAGGHFCPVARLGGRPADPKTLIMTQEIELPIDGDTTCDVQPDRPEFYFCRDLRGYGWCFRKGSFLNVGLGRIDPHGLSRHVAEFLDWAGRERGVPPGLSKRMKGHAYLPRGAGRRCLADEGVLLVGDSAGLAYPRSGEGIRPAVESGILAAETILQCGRDYRRERLQAYPDLLERTLGTVRQDDGATAPPGPFAVGVGGLLLSNRWFARKVLLNRWFLGSAQVRVDTGKRSR